jgi:alpha-glucosidase
MNEPSIRNEPTKTMPLDTVHRVDGTGFAPRLASHREIHNVFGAQNARATYEGVLKLRPDERPYVMTRATFAGGQRYSVTWTGDNTSTWNHLRLSTNMIANLGLCGYAFSGADVGAHVGSPQPDLLTKWLEIAAFQPIDRDHSAKNSNPQEPWVNGPGPEAVARRFIDLRYRLLPYSYTLAEEASRTGMPLLRPLFLEFPEVTADKHPIDLDAKGEFMLGDDLLIAPPAYLETANRYTPTLPGDSWYDFWTGLKVAKPRSLAAVAKETTEYSTAPKAGVAMETDAQRRQAAQNVAGLKILPTIDELPVYVRGGAILPMQPLVQSTEEKPAGPLELRIYPGRNCKGSMYLDDGHTFQYRQGDYLRVAYGCVPRENGVQVTVGPREGRFAPWWSQVEVVVFDVPSASARVTNGGTVIASTYDAATRSLHALLPENSNGSVLDVTF